MVTHKLKNDPDGGDVKSIQKSVQVNFNFYVFRE